MKFPLPTKRQPPPKRSPRATGYKKQPVFSYRSARSSTSRPSNRGETPQKQPAALLYRLRHVPTYLSIAALTIGLMYSLSLNSHVQLVVFGEQSYLRPRGSYQQAIDKRFADSITNRSKLTINTANLSREIQRQFPELETVNIGLPLLRHRPVVEVRLSQPALQLVTPKASYILDANGRVLFDKKSGAPSFDFGRLPRVSDDSDHTIRLGSPALTSQQVAYVYALSAQVSAKNLVIESLQLVSGGEELHMRLKGLNYLVKFSFRSDARQSSGAFLATKERLESDRAGTGEYIDVRIPERVYVK